MGEAHQKGERRRQFTALVRLPSLQWYCQVVDFGCAECKLVRRLKDLPHIREIIGVDLDEALLDDAARWTAPLPWEFLHPR